MTHPPTHSLIDSLTYLFFHLPGGLLDFIRALSPSPPSSSPPRPPRLSQVLSPSLCQLSLQMPDGSVHRWTSTARIRRQCALLDLNREVPMAVCTAGPQPRGSDGSVHRWTSTARIRWQCAPLDLNAKIECQNICQIQCQSRMPDKMPK